MLPSPPAFHARSRNGWVFAWAHGLLLTALGTAYLGVRRGEVDLFIANKAIACAGLLLIAAAMLSGQLAARAAAHADRPWARSLPTVLRFVPPRPTGLVGAMLTAVHVVVTLALLPEHFPFPTWFLDHPVETLTGLASFALLAVVVCRSLRFRRPRVRTPLVRWLLPLALLHLVWLKSAGWRDWFIEPSTWMPPWSLPVFLCGVVLTATLSALGKPARASRA